jgi:bacillithiol biosynthesis deacetylase BshB1
MIKLDILVLPVHPDDAELGCAGVILKHNAMGKKSGIVDLTRGELGTRGTPEIRAREAEAAGKILNLAVRDNLGIPDGFFQNTPEYQLKVIEVIRRYKPEIVITNAYYDRHPDHGRASDLVQTSCFLAGLRKIETLDKDGTAQEAWRPKQLLHFVQDMYIKPDILIDVSDQGIWFTISQPRLAGRTSNVYFFSRVYKQCRSPRPRIWKTNSSKICRRLYITQNIRRRKLI